MVSPDCNTVLSAVNLLDSGSSDRKRIADSLNISVSSAGKLAAFLISEEIATEYTYKSKAPGRQSKILRLNNDPVFAIANITPKHIVTEFFGYCLNICTTDYFKIHDPLFIDDSFSLYFRLIERMMPSLRGICLVSNGTPSNGSFIRSDIQGLDGLPLVSIASEHLHNKTVSLENRAFFCLDDTDGLSASILDNDGDVKISLVYNGTLISGSRITNDNLNRIKDRYGRSITSRLRYSHDFREYVSAVAELFCHVICIAEPDRIFFSSDRYLSLNEIAKLVTESLIKDHRFFLNELPQIICTKDKFDTSLRKLRIKMRNDHILSKFNSTVK